MARAVAIAGRKSYTRVAEDSGRRAWLPLCFTLALAAAAWLPGIRQTPSLFTSVFGAAAVLFVAAALFRISARRRNLTVSVELRPQHYLQACIQGSLMLYWGYYWRPVYDAVPLIVVQLLFAYAFDMLLTWSRRDNYILGFAPFPIIFSINLFLWFKPEWFYLQFVMVAVGFLAKEFIRWERDGRRVHIFNPSSFPLAVVSIWLIATGNTSMTLGPEIASTQFNPPYIYLVLFLAGMPGQLLFGVTTMTMSAVVTTYVLGLLYFQITGVYFFIDSYIPIAVFLGMHLLFTDPATAPRTELGRIAFGVMYGVGNMVLYEVLTRAGIPSFYDKLLPVPIMNVSVRLIDYVVRSTWVARLDPGRLGAALAPRRRYLVYVAMWVMVFSGMNAAGAVGDEHPGHQVPFWQQACQQGAVHGCDKLAVILDSYCEEGSGWACNEVAVLRWHRRVPGYDGVGDAFTRACLLGFKTGCANTAAALLGAPRQSPPQLADYRIVLGTGKGPLPDTTPVALYTRACDQGWLTGCEDLGGTFLKQTGVERNAAAAVTAFAKACDGGLATSCSNAGLMYYSGDGLPADKSKGLAYLERACKLGHPNACQWRKEVSSLSSDTETE